MMEATTRYLLLVMVLGLTLLGIVRFGAWFDAQVAATSGGRNWPVTRTE